MKELSNYKTSRQEMRTSADPKLRAMVPVIEENIFESEKRIQTLKELRNNVKDDLEFANHYNGEGNIYIFFIIYNYNAIQYTSVVIILEFFFMSSFIFLYFYIYRALCISY